MEASCSLLLRHPTPHFSSGAFPSLSFTFQQPAETIHTTSCPLSVYCLQKHHISVHLPSYFWRFGKRLTTPFRNLLLFSKVLGTRFGYIRGLGSGSKPVRSISSDATSSSRSINAALRERLESTQDESEHQNSASKHPR
ncbi:uncharacterized protein LOC121983771 [Zingiber officinale]|uniref:uncharacterized protein LOC121983771 n=1 Tax=Zingiber officinale TaxID=94328 RepID=UPI001C4C5651|nr:uncharacterized protein LOC121983771 [Zingiber officinale]